MVSGTIELDCQLAGVKTKATNTYLIEVSFENQRDGLVS